MQPELNRRDFLVTKLAAGFAAAVSPVTAQTITTDTQGIDAGEVKIPVREGELPGYRARPAEGGGFPIVLVVQEIFGVHEHIRDLCRRFAKLGHLAVAPELYARQGDVSKLPDFKEIQSKVVSKVPDEQVMADLDSAVEWAQSTQKGDGRRLAIAGFCWGGRIVWLYGAHNPRLKAGAAWYGRLTGQTDELHPKNPLDVASKIKTPIIGFYGGKDQGIPLDTVDQMKAALKAAKSKSEIMVYPDAPHGFNADYRPSYKKDDAQNAWGRMIDWFGQHGAA